MMSANAATDSTNALKRSLIRLSQSMRHATAQAGELRSKPPASRCLVWYGQDSLILLAETAGLCANSYHRVPRRQEVAFIDVVGPNAESV
jgi:hypothetical protein